MIGCRIFDYMWLAIRKSSCRNILFCILYRLVQPLQSNAIRECCRITQASIFPKRIFLTVN